MTQRTIVQLIDDLDGGEADETITFALDGRAFEIDLSIQHAKELRELFARYAHAGRSARGLNIPRSAKPVRESSDLKAIREWATEHGYKVSSRGRIAGDVEAAYRAAH